MSKPHSDPTESKSQPAERKPAPYAPAAAPTQQMFAEAQQHHQAERFQEAAVLYRRIVDIDAKHVGAWHLLGLACLGQNKLDEAAENFQQVLSLSPNHLDALTQLGIVRARQHRLTDAVATFRRAIEICPEHAKAHNNMGVALTQLGRTEEGLACYREATRLLSDYPEAHFNLGIALAERKEFGEAIASYERAIQARPAYPDALSNLGMLLLDVRRPGDAIIYLEQAVRLDPNSATSHSNLSLGLADAGRFADAVASCDASLRLQPLNSKTHMNRGNALSSLGRVDEALASYDLAIRLQPDYPNARWNRSLAWLSQGDFKRGWAEYEWRWQRAETKVRHFPEPRWDGALLQGKTILLWCEQGLGDTLQFVRYAPILKQQGAAVWLECPAKMVPLLSTVPGIDRVLPEGNPLPPGFDCQAPLMSLPFLCGTSLSNVPNSVPYVSADPAHVENWNRDLGGSTHFKIGVAWQGNPKHRFDQHRSFPLHWLRIFASLEGVQLYSLQKGPGIEKLGEAGFSIIDLGSRLDETCGAFQETAAAVQSLDLVITCDSALAHLAGALGRPVWMALSQPADWRWLHDRDDTPWYPTMRLFRQSKLGEWRPVFERMREELHKLRQSASPTIQVEVAPGELLDKLAILQIKSERIVDPAKQRNVRAELAVVEATRRQAICEVAGAADLLRELKEVNERLWDIENRIRDCEKALDFGADFVGLARSVYQTNDRRAEIKRQLNEILGAKFCEEKEYHGK